MNSSKKTNKQLAGSMPQKKMKKVADIIDARNKSQNSGPLVLQNSRKRTTAKTSQPLGFPSHGDLSNYDTLGNDNSPTDMNLSSESEADLNEMISAKKAKKQFPGSMPPKKMKKVADIIDVQNKSQNSGSFVLQNSRKCTTAKTSQPPGFPSRDDLSNYESLGNDDNSPTDMNLSSESEADINEMITAKKAKKQIPGSISQKKMKKVADNVEARNKSQNSGPSNIQNSRKQTTAKTSRPPGFPSRDNLSNYESLGNDDNSPTGMNLSSESEADINEMITAKKAKKQFPGSISQKKMKKVADIVEARNKSQNSGPSNIQNSRKQTTAKTSQPPGAPNHGEFSDYESLADDDTSPTDMDLSSDSEDDINAINENEKPVRTRGPTMMANIWNLKGERIAEHFNSYNQSVDNGQLAKFCGVVARNKSLTPLRYTDWRKVPIEKKDEIWRVVKTRFKLAPRRRKWVLGQVSKSLRNFKKMLYNENFSNYQTIGELKANVDPRTTKDEWEELVNTWWSTDWQTKSDKAKTSRSCMKMPHTSGSISFARRVQMEFEKTGKRPIRAKVFSRYHKRSTGKPVTAEAAVALEKIDKLIADSESNGQVLEVVDDFAPLEDDVLAQVLGPERNGRVRGMSYGVTPKMFGSANIELMKDLKESEEKNVKLQKQVATLTNQVNQVTTFLAKLTSGSSTPFEFEEDLEDENSDSPLSDNEF